jgi:hypothetical protein
MSSKLTPEQRARLARLGAVYEGAPGAVELTFVSEEAARQITDGRSELEKGLGPWRPEWPDEEPTPEAEAKERARVEQNLRAIRRTGRATRDDDSKGS